MWSPSCPQGVGEKRAIRMASFDKNGRYISRRCSIVVPARGRQKERGGLLDLFLFAFSCSRVDSTDRPNKGEGALTPSSRV